MASSPSDPNTAMMLGQMDARLRELIHQGNNQAMKNDAVARTLAKLETVPGDIADIKERLTALEHDRLRRDTERSVFATIVRSPLAGWVLGFGLALWAWLKGHSA